MDSSPTQYTQAAILLNLCGLQAVEAAHVNSSWFIGETEFAIPPVWRCGCESCALKSVRRGQNGPWPYDIMRGRVIDLARVGRAGAFVSLYLTGRKVQMAQTVRRIAQVPQSIGLSWDALSRWGPHFLHHRHGIEPEIIASWNNRPRGIHLEPPFPGATLAWEKLNELNKSFEGILS